MAVKQAIPGIPNKPTMIAVKKFMGMCNPKDAPNKLKKNKNKTPIVTFITI